ncbi:hypothetical protein H6503_05600 [Candidatus Woesearchaeota archaeon]|nr:hypothetical protein [Candidatus Woesearchaeota archaeon]
MKIKADLHLHSLLKGYRNRRKAIKIFQRLKDFDIRVAAFTEHSYHNPKDSFRMMQEVHGSLAERNEFFRSIEIFAGLEYRTKGGNEIIIIDKESKPRLYNTFSELHDQDIETAIKISNQEGYAVFIPHPYMNVPRWAKDPKDLEFVSKLFDRYELGVSIHNGSFDTALEFGRLLRLDFPNLERISTTPKDYLSRIKPAFYAGGSDSHNPYTIGSGIELIIKEFSREHIFNAIMTNNYDEIIRPEKSNARIVRDYFVGGWRQLITTSGEYVLEAYLNLKH